MGTKTDKAMGKYRMSAWLAAIPLVVLIVMLAMTIKVFGADAIEGGSQISLLVASSVACIISIGICGCKWSALERGISDNIHTSASAIIILLLIGAVASTWMLSGVVPTLIYYGLQIIHPNIFLVVACIICAIVSIVTGSSWTTIATIGVALMGIGIAQGFSEGWIAGAIISGAYFGDKVSALSDTTVLASSTARVPLFSHIKYMMITTVPSFLVAVTVFFIAGFQQAADTAGQTEAISNALQSTFNISPWLLLVPITTMLLILRKLPALITLFVAVVIACVAIVASQVDILHTIGGDDGFGVFRGLITICTSSTNISSGVDIVDELIATRGMKGMLNTIWLVLCAMCFGGVMSGSGMLNALTQLFLRIVHRTVSIVASTVSAGILCNICTADQYISIIITSNTFRRLYAERGLEGRLLSRSVEDSATVTSVLIPWNSCGMTQSTVLGVATLTYLPYCIFNLTSPLMSILVAAIGYRIKRNTPTESDEAA